MLLGAVLMWALELQLILFQAKVPWSVARSIVSDQMWVLAQQEEIWRWLWMTEWWVWRSSAMFQLSLAALKQN
jgi:hypothetical protein